MDELERQLRDKATEIHETALLGKQLLQQQESLYAKVASLAPADYSPASPASPASPGAAPAALDTLQDDLAQLHSTSPTSPAQLRRSRNTNNAQRTSNDIELATSIGTSLLAEVRRLQALLLEKEAILRDEQLNKEAALSACESEKRSKERGEQLSEKLKEELWTQELLAQELRTTLTTLQTQSTKSELLLARQSKDLLATKDTNEVQKTEIDRLTVGMEEMKNKYDLEMALMRKSQAGILREKSDLRAVLDGLQNDKRRGFKRENSLLSREMDSPSDAGRRYIDEEEDDDEVARRGRRKTGDGLERMSKDDLFKEFNQLDQELEEHDSFDGSPAVQRHGSILPSALPADVKALQASLATAEQKIAQLQADLAATRSTTTQSNYLPADDQSSYSPRGSLELNEEWENSSDQSHSGLYGTPRRISLSGPTGTGRGRGRGRGRGGRGASASGSRMGSRLSVGGGDLSIGEGDESVDTLERNAGDSREPSTSPGGIFSHQFVQQNYEEDFDEDDFEGSENGSVMSSPQANGSFQDSPLGRNGRRSNRNSLVGKSNRPTSGMFSNSPGGFVALGAGFGAVAAAGSVVARDGSTGTVVSPTKEPIREAIVWKDMGIMTDPLPLAPPPPVVIVKETKEITTQTESVLPPVVATSEISIQTDYIPPPLPPAPIPIPVVVPPTMVDAGTEIKPVAIKMVERGILTDRVNIPLLPVPLPLPLPIPVKKVKMSNQGVSTDPPPPIIVVSTKEAGVSTLPLPVPVVVPVIPRPTQSIATSMEPEFLQRGRSVGHAQTEVQIAVVDYDSADDEDDEEDATHRFYMTSREGRGVGESETDAGAETDFQDANEDPSPLIPSMPFTGAPGTKRDFLVSSTTTTPMAARKNRQSLSPDLSANNRGSINTFGLPDPSTFSTPSSIHEDPIEVSAAVAAEFTRKEENGLMGPPLSTKPRASTLTSLSSRSNRSSIVSGSATGPARPLSPPPNDLLIRAQSPAFDEIYARRGLLNVPNRAGGRGTASAGNLRGGSESEGNETVVAGQGRPEGMGRYPSSSALVGGVSRTGGKRKNVDYSDTLSFSDLDDYSQTPTQQRGASHPVSRTQSGTGTQNGRASMESGRTSEMEHMYLPSTGVARPPVPPKPYPSPSRTRPSANSTTLRTPRNRPSQAQSQANADDEASASTDPALIHAITQTMIGEFLHKYTRKPIGKGIVGGKRHERFFWVHPYTKMLYWSGRDPGAQNGGGENRSKSVLIMGVRQIVDPNPYPEGLHSASIIIETSNRDITITASSRERHDMWYNAINFLLARPDVASESTPRKQYSSSTRSQTRKTFSSESFSSRKFPAVNRLVGSFGNRSESRLGNRSESRLGSRARGEYDGESDEDDIHRTAKGKGKASVQSTYKKRSDRAPSAYEAELAGLSTTPRSIRTFRSVNSFGAKRSGNASGTERSDGEGFDIVARTERGESEMDDEDFFEGLENVRACCGGKHDVGSLSRKNHSHSHSHRHRVQSDIEGDDYHSSQSRNHSKTSVATTPSMRSNHTGHPSVGASSVGRNKLSLPTFRGKDSRASAAMAPSSSASSTGSPVIGRN